jgi:hypothetical protein
MEGSAAGRAGRAIRPNPCLEPPAGLGFVLEDRVCRFAVMADSFPEMRSGACLARADKRLSDHFGCFGGVVRSGIGRE